MTYLADLHVHSHYSLATSRTATLPGLAAWAGIKGLALVATGDCTHPGWLRELEELLRPAEPGFFRLRNEQIPAPLPGLNLPPAPVRFILSTEVSCIYRKDGRTRKVHCLIFLPDLEAARRLNRRLALFGNLHADGRPTLRLDARDLLAMLMDEAPGGFLVPAHVWTPWFSLFGARSGFDSPEECFGDLSAQVFALETGLSSDPAMIRRVSGLDRFSLISNSDCHAPAKLGREANIFTTPFDYYSLRDGLKAGGRGLTATIEFYPQEGKYFADGHRRCRYREEDEGRGTLPDSCPVCLKPLTIGVRSRIEQLADRATAIFPPGPPAEHHLVGLAEIIAEITGRGVNSKTVRDFYLAAINRLGPELPLLLRVDKAEIAGFSEPLATAIIRVRQGRVVKENGFDGQPGRIRLFTARELEELRPPYFHWQ